MLWFRWTAVNAAGSVVSIGSGALIGWALLAALESQTGVLPASLLSAVFFGLIGGVLFGYGQHQVISWPLPFVPTRVWVSATALSGILGWAGAGGLISSVGDGFGAYLLRGALAGMAAGAVLGVPQALVLQPQIERAWHWVWANALGWGAAMPVLFLAAGSLPDDAGWIRIGFAAVLSLAVAGAVAGAISGRVLLWLVEDRLHPNRYTIHALEGISQASAGNDGPVL